MPYTFKKTGNKYTAFKKTGDKLKVVGHTKGTEKAKEAYKTALNIGAAKASGAKIPNLKKENMTFDNQIGDVYAVQRPYDGCEVGAMIRQVDPMMGVQDIDHEQIHGFYPDEKQAMQIAEKLYKEFRDMSLMQEKKKDMVIEKIKDTMDKLEEMRSKNLTTLKENPEDKRSKNKIAELANKIDDLMEKLHRIKSSKKPMVAEEDKKKKKALKEGKFEVVPGKTKSGDPALLVKKDGVILSNDDIDKLSDSEKQEIVDLKKKARVIGPGKSTFKINAPTNYKHDPEDESNWA